MVIPHMPFQVMSRGNSVDVTASTRPFNLRMHLAPIDVLLFRRKPDDADWLKKKVLNSAVGKNTSNVF